MFAGLKIMVTFATHFGNKCPDGGIGTRAKLYSIFAVLIPFAWRAVLNLEYKFNKKLIS